MSTVIVELDREPLKKASIKVTPSMALRSIALEACQKIGLPNPESYGLKYSKQELDLSLPFRFANLPAGSIKLILYRSNAKITKNEFVEVALQIDEIGRLIIKVPSNFTLLQMLIYAEQNNKDNLLTFKSVNKLFSVTLFEPRCIYFTKEIAGVDQLNSNTLEGIGLNNGNGIIKVSYFQTGKNINELESVIEAASKDMQLKLSNSILAVSKPQTKLSLNPQPVSNNIINVQVKDPVDSNPEPNAPAKVDEESWEYKTNLKMVQITPTEPPELPDTFFQLNGEEAKYIMKPVEEPILKTKAMRDKEALEKQMKFPKCSIRLKFPDSMLIQMEFDSSEKVSLLFTYTQRILIDKLKSNFKLFTTPPHLDLIQEKTFYNHNLCPCSIVHITFNPSQSGPFILPEVLKTLNYIPPSPEKSQPYTSESGSKKQSGSADASAKTSKESLTSDNVTKKLSKFLRLSK